MALFKSEPNRMIMLLGGVRVFDSEGSLETDNEELANALAEFPGVEPDKPSKKKKAD